ncbi:MFS transporter [Thermomicrobium sp. 4228-Ro]|uniref:MFS transporter n=1 Tax=Thermomicrobium sp. 4228-Ro TaxID=2993937 RepID=UPI0022494EB4|nr:MFS transporter [Thermomicrobium sp. 4228-Ro]MCX2727923.1 MFS transporter [Thermomicrobium sp. 4228-Ro]
MSDTPPLARPAAAEDVRARSPVRSERQRVRQSFLFGVANGGLLLLGDALIHPVLVLAVFVDRLSESQVLVGLVPALSVSLWFLPQAVAAALVEGRRSQLPWAAWGGVVRALAIGLLAAILLAGSLGSDRQLLIAFFLCYAVYNLAAGFAFVPLVELSARAIPADRRGFFFSQRNFWGALLALLAGLVVQRALASGDAGFTVLFATSFAALALAAYTTLWIAERPAPAQPRSLRAWFHNVPAVLARRSVRRFLVFRSFLALSTIADPFFIVYAQHRLGLPAETAGTYLALSAIARVATNPLWGWVVSRWGNRQLLQVTAMLRLLMPLLAVTLGVLVRWDRFLSLIGDVERFVFIAFSLVFLTYGAALSAQMLANFTAVLDLARPHERPTLVGVTNSVLGVVALVPMLGGLVVDRFGFDAVFVLALMLALLALVTSGLLAGPRRAVR